MNATQRNARPEIPFALIASRSLADVESVLSHYLPVGRNRGLEYEALNPTRNDRNIGSFHISKRSGKWCDHASNDGGGDLISLVAYLRHGHAENPQLAAAIELAGFLGISLDAAPNTTACQREDTAQRDRQHEERERQRADDAQKERQRHGECRQQSGKLWQQAREHVDAAHPYLRAKGIRPYGARQKVELLLVPVRGTDGTLHGLQFIGPDGSKKFKTGTHKVGHYCALGDKPGVGANLIVCEGWATGCSLHEAAGLPVAVAFDAGNLRPVAEALAIKFPLARLTVAGDADPSGRGQQAAREAAAAVGGLVALPDFAAFTPEELEACDFTPDKPPTDFNDLHQLQRALAERRAA